MYGAEAVILQLSAQMKSHLGTSLLGVFAHAGQPGPELHTAAVRVGIPSELIFCRGQLDLAVPASIRALVDRSCVDVVHTHGYKADIYTYLAFRGRKRPALVSTCHTWYDNDLAVRFYGAADRWVLRGFDEVIAVSAEVRNRLLRAGVRKEKVHLIRNGVTVPTSLPCTAVDCNEPSTQVRVGLVGRLAPEKGVDLFLRAVAQLIERHPEAEFVVAGDGPERAKLTALLHELGLQDRVTLLGQQEDMAAFYGSLDLLVSASRQEGLPMALLEGMAAGLAVIATAVGEVPQLVQDGRTGLLVNPESPPAIAEAIETLLNDIELRKQYGLAGRQRVVDLFSADRMATDYMTIYRKAKSNRNLANMQQSPGGRG